MNIIQAQNPFFEKYSTPHGTIPFEKIKTEHYEPAIREGINRHNAEIDAITNNPEAATFANTVAAYEKSGELLNQVSTVFGNLLSAETNDDMQELAKSIMPLLSEHGNNITLNEKLFARIKAVYDQKDQANLTPEQNKLLEKVYNSFVRSGANLEGEAKEQYRALSKELSLLTLQFGENNLKETNDYKLVLTDPAQLAGLPQSAIDAAAETAKEKGVEGWVFTLQAPSYSPFMTYASNRDLRCKLYMAYNTKCTHDNETNNLEIVKKLVNTRLAIAQLLGYSSFAEYNLQERMAENSGTILEECEKRGIKPESLLKEFYEYKASAEQVTEEDEFDWTKVSEMVNSGIMYEIFGKYKAPLDEYDVPETLIFQAAEKTDTAIFVIGRNSGGEECDRHLPEDYYLTRSEESLLKDI